MNGLAAAGSDWHSSIVDPYTKGTTVLQARRGSLAERGSVTCLSGRLTSALPVAALALAATLVAPLAMAQTRQATAENPKLPAQSEPDAKASVEASGPPMTMEQFVDRLMMAESGGRLDARNPRSTALGPYQFIESTFLAVARRHFAVEVASMTPQQILALRTDLKFSRRAAEAFTRDNAAVLQSADIPPSYPNLRLAFLLGAGGATSILKAPPDAPLAGLLTPAVLVANPFMASLTVRGLVQRAAREVAQPPTSLQGVEVPPGTVVRRRALPPAVTVRCNLKLPSCKRWLALQTAKLRTVKKGAKTATLAKGGLPSPPARLGAPLPPATKLTKR